MNCHHPRQYPQHASCSAAAHLTVVVSERADLRAAGMATPFFSGVIISQGVPPRSRTGGDSRLLREIRSSWPDKEK